MAIVPDTADWTWVLERPCPECGFDTAAVSTDRIGPMFETVASAWRAVLAERDPVALRTRPSPQQWSALEYGCHVADVFRIGKFRIELLLTEVEPVFPNWDQDRTAIEDRYADQDPRAVAVGAYDAGKALAAVFAGVGDGEWVRQGTRSNGSVFTVESLGRYLLHDPVHHLSDVAEPIF